MRIDGKVVIITGASSGIGRAVALRLAKDGAKVVLAARRAELLTCLETEICSSGGQAYAVQTDVTHRPDIDRLVELTRARWGQVDVLFNNAGVAAGGTLARMHPEKLRRQVAVNLTAVIECAQAVLPGMIERRSGHIINVASIAGLIAIPNSGVYSATKYGVVGFSEALLREVRRHHVKVTAFCPGFTATAFTPALKMIMDRRTGSPRARRDAPWIPGVMSPEYVAGVVAGIIRWPRRKVVIPYTWSPLVPLANIFSGIADILLGLYRGD